MSVVCARACPASGAIPFLRCTADSAACLDFGCSVCLSKQLLPPCFHKQASPQRSRSRSPEGSGLFSGAERRALPGLAQEDKRRRDNLCFRNEEARFSWSPTVEPQATSQPQPTDSIEYRRALGSPLSPTAPYELPTTLPALVSFEQISTEVGQGQKRQNSCRVSGVGPNSADIGRPLRKFGQLRPNVTKVCRHFGQLGRTLVKHGPFLADFAGGAAKIYYCLVHKRGPTIDKQTTTTCATLVA